MQSRWPQVWDLGKEALLAQHHLTPFKFSDQVLPSFSPPHLPSLGTYIPQAAGIALHPHEWRHSRQKSSTPPGDPRKNYPYMDGSFSEDDWDKPSRYGGVGGGREAHLQMWVSLHRDKGAWECDGVASDVLRGVLGW